MKVTEENLQCAVQSVEALRGQVTEISGADDADVLIENILAVYARDFLDAVETEGCVVLHLPEAQNDQ